jgi:hypothetical protein
MVIGEASVSWMTTKPMRGGLREKTLEEVTMPRGKKRRPKIEVRETSRRKRSWEARVAGVRVTPAATTD